MANSIAKYKLKLSLLALGALVCATPVILTACGSSKNDKYVSTYRYDEGVLSYNPLSISRVDQDILHGYMNELLFYTDSFYQLKGGIAKDITNDINSTGLAYSTNGGGSWSPYDPSQGVASGANMWKIRIKDNAYFVDKDGNKKDQIDADSFINSFAFYAYEKTGEEMPKLFGNEWDDGGAFVFDSYVNWYGGVVGGGYLPTVDAAREAVTIGPDGFIQKTGDYEFTFKSSAPWILDFFQGSTFVPIPDAALEPYDPINNRFGYDDEGSHYGVGPDLLGEDEEAADMAIDYAWYTGAYLPKDNAIANGNSIIFEARTKNLIAPNKSNVKKYTFNIVDSSRRDPSSGRADYEGGLTTTGFAVNTGDESGFTKYVGNLNNLGIYTGSKYFPKSDKVHWVDIENEDDSSNWLITYNLNANYATLVADEFEDGYFSPTITKVFSGPEANPTFDMTQKQLYQRAEIVNNLLLKDNRIRAYIAYNFNRSNFASYWTNNMEESTFKSLAVVNQPQVTSRGVYNKWTPYGLKSLSDGRDYTEVVNEKINEQLGPNSTYSTNSGVENFYHNYNTGKLIFGDSPSGANWDLFNAGYNTEKTVITDYEKVLRAVALEVNDIIPGIVGTAGVAELATTNQFVTLCFPIKFAETDLGEEYKTAMLRTFENFNSVDGAKLKMVPQWCDVSSVTNKGYSPYPTYQPFYYGGEQLSAWGHGKYSDFNYIGWGSDYGDPYNFLNDAFGYYANNFLDDYGNLGYDNPTALTDLTSTANIFAQISYEATQANNATYSSDDDRLTALAAIEAKIFSKNLVLPWYGTDLVGGYALSCTQPSVLPITSNSSSNRVANGVTLNKKALTQKQYYRTRYIYNDINGRSNAWYNADLVNKFGTPKPTDKDYKDILAKKN